MPKLTVGVQEALIALLCYDDAPKGARYVRSLIPPGVFDPFYRDIATAAAAYLDEFKKPPGEHTLDIVDSLRERFPAKADFYTRIYDSLLETRRTINREYVLKRAVAFVRFQKLRQGMTEALDALEQETEESVETAEAALTKCMKDRVEGFSPGLLFSDVGAVLAGMEAEEPGTPTGIRELDIAGLGPKRKRLHVFGAPPKRGKTWYLCRLAKMAVLAGVPVIYISCEVSEIVLARRLLQTFFSITKRQAEKLQRLGFERDDLGRFVSMDVVSAGKRPAFTDKNINTRISSFLGRLKHRPRLYLKEFPTGSLTVKGLEGYLDGMESLGVIPGLVLIDYMDIMDVDPKNYRHSIDSIYKGVRGLAVSRNIAIASATQGSKEGANSTTMRGEHVAEDYRKLATVDELITYSQTPDEKELGLARLLVAAAREDADGFSVLISQAYAAGQFCLDSVRLSSTYWDVLEEEKGDGEEDEE